MDVLTDIVERIELRSQVYFRTEFTAPFSMSVPEDRRRIRFHVAGPGRSWVGVGDRGVYYENGDLILVPHGSAHILASAPTQAALPLAEVLAVDPPVGGVFRHGGAGQRTSLVCGHFEFDETLVHPLIAGLAPLIHLKAGAGVSFAWVSALLQAADAEARSSSPAQHAMARRLSEILFIQVLRAAEQDGSASRGLLGCLADPQLGRALRALHASPAADWSLARLAAQAGMSRSVFAERFRARVGVTPMQYLTDRRMQEARRLLEDPTLSVGEVGQRVGYASEAAFNRAFRARLGEPPGRYRRADAKADCEMPLSEDRTRTRDASAIPSSF